jgi:F0F1-type ATP synthase alpha subunit
MLAHIRSNNADLLEQINAEGDFSDEIAAAIGKAIEGFKANGVY